MLIALYVRSLRLASSSHERINSTSARLPSVSVSALSVVISNKDQKKQDIEVIENKLDKKVGRNEKCPCGSGKKFKHCHGNI